jgi:ABC-type branched-subunit amino acid transport system permease subunit
LRHSSARAGCASWRLALLYVLLALGLNIVVGYAGLLDLGYVAFYAVGAYMYALLASPHLLDNFESIKAAFPERPAHADLGSDSAGGGPCGAFRRPPRGAYAEAAR